MVKRFSWWSEKNSNMNVFFFFDAQADLIPIVGQRLAEVHAMKREARDLSTEKTAKEAVGYVGPLAPAAFGRQEGWKPHLPEHRCSRNIKGP